MSENSPSQPGEPAGVLVVRVWMEPHASSALRARITRSLDVAAPLSEVSIESDEEAVVATVRRWLREFRSRHAPGP